ncbi:hypothetical protein AC792_08750 [Arthrobacter sp. RIT-PI-e]|nr:hypothetical protein AC792_08750 [Arthrobacter sp. RIT-PI-e]
MVRGNLTVLWEKRLHEVEEFRVVNGRFPTYRPHDGNGQDRSEKVLVIWLGRQRTWLRKNTVDPARHHSLDVVLAGWNT